MVERRNKVVENLSDTFIEKEVKDYIVTLLNAKVSNIELRAGEQHYTKPIKGSLATIWKGRRKS